MKWNDVLILIVLGILLILGFGYINRDGLLKYITIEKVDTVYSSKVDTLYKDTTIYKDKFIPVKEEIIRHDTIKSDSTIILPITSKQYTDTICASDSIIVQSYISGYNPKLDSLRVTLKNREIIKTNTITITKTEVKYRKINIGLQGGYGYGFKSKQLEPYIGVGVSITF